MEVDGGYAAVIGQFAVLDGRGYALVHPVPDGGAHNGRIGVYHLPVFVQVANGAAHRVGVFAHNERPVRYPLGLGAEPLRGEIAIVVDIGLVAVCVADYRAGRVQGADCFAHCDHILARASFVTKRPHNDAGMVLVALYKGFGPVHVCQAPDILVAYHSVGAP